MRKKMVCLVMVLMVAVCAAMPKKSYAAFAIDDAAIIMLMLAAAGITFTSQDYVEDVVDGFLGASGGSYDGLLSDLKDSYTLLNGVPVIPVPTRLASSLRSLMGALFDYFTVDAGRQGSVSVEGVGTGGLSSAFPPPSGAVVSALSLVGTKGSCGMVLLDTYKLKYPTDDFNYVAYCTYRYFFRGLDGIYYQQDVDTSMRFNSPSDCSPVTLKVDDPFCKGWSAEKYPNGIYVVVASDGYLNSMSGSDFLQRSSYGKAMAVSLGSGVWFFHPESSASSEYFDSMAFWTLPKLLDPIYEAGYYPDAAVFPSGAVSVPYGLTFPETLTAPDVLDNFEQRLEEGAGDEAMVFPVSGVIDSTLPWQQAQEEYLVNVNDLTVPEEGTLTDVTSYLNKVLTSVKALPAAISAAVIGTGSLNFDGFKGLSLANVFPFCIPFDLKNALLAFNAPPADPVWEISFAGTFMEPAGSIVIDMKQFESLFKIVRFFIYGGFVVSLILLTRRIIKG